MKNMILVEYRHEFSHYRNDEQDDLGNAVYVDVPIGVHYAARKKLPAAFRRWANKHGLEYTERGVRLGQMCAAKIIKERSHTDQYTCLEEMSIGEFMFKFRGTDATSLLKEIYKFNPRVLKEAEEEAAQLAQEYAESLY